MDIFIIDRKEDKFINKTSRVVTSCLGTKFLTTSFYVVIVFLRIAQLLLMSMLFLFSICWNNPYNRYFVRFRHKSIYEWWNLCLATWYLKSRSENIKISVYGVIMNNFISVVASASMFIQLFCALFHGSHGHRIAIFQSILRNFVPKSIYWIFKSIIIRGFFCSHLLHKGTMSTLMQKKPTFISPIAGHFSVHKIERWKFLAIFIWVFLWSLGHA